MNKEKIKVNVTILENNYSLMCEPHEQGLLVNAAETLNATLAGMRRANPKLPLERLLIMGSLQLAFDLLQERQTQANDVAAVNQMTTKLLSALEQESSNQGA